MSQLSLRSFPSLGHLGVAALCGWLVVGSAGCADDSGATGGSGGATSGTGGAGGAGGESDGGGAGGERDGGGAGGESEGGAGGGMACTPGTQQPCYTGPSGTQGVGLCVAGMQTCNADGHGFGTCNGEVTPTAETCGVAGDEDCDGLTNEEGADCACVPSSIQGCYSYDPATEGVGICQGGTQTCNADGLGYGACMGEVGPAVETCNTPADDDCDGAPLSCSGNHVWSKRFGDGGNQHSYSVATDAGGSVLVAGYFWDTMDLGGGPLASAGGSDVFVAKLDPAGNVLWSKRFGDGSNQYVSSVATDASGNVLITGYFMSTVDFGGGPLASAGGFDFDAFIAKLDPAGNHLWSKRFGDATDQRAQGVATDALGNIVVTGYFAGTVDFGGGPLTSGGGWDVFVAGFDSAGNHVWSKRFGTANEQYGHGVATDATGNVLVTGPFGGVVDFGGGPLTSAGNNDVFVAKLDSAGNHLWSKRFGDTNNQHAYSIATDAAGNVLVAGHFNSTVDFGGGPLTSAGNWDVFVAKLDSAGNCVWSKRFGDASNQYAFSLAADAAGSVIVVGHGNGTVDFGGGPLLSAGDTDGFVAKLDPAGNHVWSKRFGDANTQYGLGVATDALGNVLLTGYFDGTVDFGGGPLVYTGGYDGFVAKLAP